VDMLSAMQDTLSIAAANGLYNVSSDIPESDYLHLLSMYERAQEGNFSPAKLGRWLGWMQACVVINSMGDISFEDMKRINLSHKGQD